MKKVILILVALIGLLPTANAGMVDKALKQWRVWCPLKEGNLRCLKEEAKIATEIDWSNAIWGEDAVVGAEGNISFKDHAGSDYEKWTASAEKDFLEALTPKKGVLKRAVSKEDADLLIKIYVDKLDFNYNWGKGGHQLYVWGKIEIIDNKTGNVITKMNIDNFQGTGGGTSRDRGFKRGFGKYGIGGGLLLMAEYEDDPTTY